MMSMDTGAAALTSTEAAGSGLDGGLTACGTGSLRMRLLKQGSTHKRFDSGDWCMERLGLTCKDEFPMDVSMDQLSPKLCPEPADGQTARPPSVLQHRSDLDGCSAVLKTSSA